MGFLARFIARVILNGAALYLAGRYFSGFVLGGGTEGLVVASVVLALLHTFLRPILKLVATPLVWITFGVFNLAINVIILWVGDQLLTTLAIGDLPTLFWTSLILALANSFF